MTQPTHHKRRTPGDIIGRAINNAAWLGIIITALYFANILITRQ